MISDSSGDRSPAFTGAGGLLDGIPVTTAVVLEAAFNHVQFVLEGAYQVIGLVGEPGDLDEQDSFDLGGRFDINPGGPVLDDSFDAGFRQAEPPGYNSQRSAVGDGVDIG